MADNDDLTPGDLKADILEEAANEEVNAAASQDDIDAMMNGGGMSQPQSAPFEINQEFGNSSSVNGDSRELDAVYDIPVQLSAVLGKAHMPVNQLLKLGRGAVVELDKRVGEPVEIFVNNKLIARGEVVLVEDRLGITMTEIIKSDRA